MLASTLPDFRSLLFGEKTVHDTSKWEDCSTLSRVPRAIKVNTWVKFHNQMCAQGRWEVASARASLSIREKDVGVSESGDATCFIANESDASVCVPFTLHTSNHPYWFIDTPHSPEASLGSSVRAHRSRSFFKTTGGTRYVVYAASASGNRCDPGHRMLLGTAVQWASRDKHGWASGWAYTRGNWRLVRDVLMPDFSQ